MCDYCAVEVIKFIRHTFIIHMSALTSTKRWSTKSLLALLWTTFISPLSSNEVISSNEPFTCILVAVSRMWLNYEKESQGTSVLVDNFFAYDCGYAASRSSQSCMNTAFDLKSYGRAQTFMNLLGGVETVVLADVLLCIVTLMGKGLLV